MKPTSPSKAVFLLILGAMLVGAGVIPAQTRLFLSMDVPVTVAGTSYAETDILQYNAAGFAPFLSGASLGIPAGVNLDAVGFYGTGVLFAVDVPATLGGIDFSERDLILYNGSSYSKFLDGTAAGLPAGARINAATVEAGGNLIFALDVPATLDGTSFSSNDLIAYDGTSFSLYFKGSDHGIPENVNIEGVTVGVIGEFYLALDIPCEVAGLEVDPRDVILWYGGSFSPHFKGAAAGLPAGSGIDALAVLWQTPVIDDISFVKCLSELCQSPITVTAHDPEGGTLSYAWEALNGGSIIGLGASVLFDPPDTDPHPCPYQIKVTITSSVLGLAVSRTLDIYVHLAGDANADGTVNVRDTRLLRDHFMESPPTDPRADVNCDGAVNVRDLRHVRDQFMQTGCSCSP